MIFSMEQWQEDQWINVAYGDFDTIHLALEDCQFVAKSFGISISELRVKPIDKIPKNGITVCSSCGAGLKFRSDGRCICVSCGKVYDLDNTKLK